MYTSMFRKAMLGDTATLNLDFTTGTLDSRLTFTRSGTGTYINSSGYVTTASTNVERFDYDPATLAPRGLLIEPSATNLLNFSETFATTGGTNNNWADTNLTRTSTNNTSPRNDATALRITASAGNGTLISSAAIGTSASRTLSVWLRRVTGTGNIQYTLDNGSSYTTQAITSSWVRYSFAATTAAQRVGFRVVTSGDAIEIWGAQLEAGSGASSYIATVASQVTRNPDVCYADNISSWYTQGIGTMLFVGRPIQSVARNYLNFSTGASQPRLLMYGTNATEVILYLQNGTGSSLIFPSGSLTLGSVNRIAASFKQAQYSCVINGGTVGTSTTASPAMPSAITRLNIGMRNDQVNQFGGHVMQVKYYPIVLPDAQIKTLTTP